MSDTFLMCDDCGNVKHTSVWYPHNHNSSTEDLSLNVCMECMHEEPHISRVSWDVEDERAEEKFRQHDRELD